MRGLLRKRVIVPVVVVLALAATAGMVYASQQPAKVTYRTAAATMGTVTQVLPISGNLAAVGQTDLDFAVSGRVQAVNVQAGQAVHAGDLLATLDTAALQGALTQAQANLSSAQAKLSLDRAGPTAQNLAQAQAAVNTATVSLQSNRTSLADTQAVNAQAVAQAKSAWDAAQNTEASDCAANPSSAQCANDRQMTSQASNSYNAAQVKAQQTNDQAQAQVNSAEANLQNAQAALTALQQGSTTQQIQMDQSQVTVAQVSVDTAQRNLNQATLTAPADGTVGQVNIVVGQSVSGSGSSSSSSAASSTASTTSSSTTHAVSLITPGSYAVTGSVSDAQVGQVAVGQAARVTPAGSTEALSGKVSAVATVATVTSGVATFGVTVAIDGDNPSLHAGVSASVSIIINQVSQVLTVPASAVRGTGAASSVQVLVNGKPQSTPVQVGATDALRAQILSGLNPGDQVVIATVSSTVPTTTNRNGLGSGGFGGGGGGGGRGPGG
jgi:multidrug efflux pump subunit AcrA (membrane-fusion protein)